MRLHHDAQVNELIVAARSAVLALDGELFRAKQAMREGNGAGGLRPFNRRAISADDRRWIEQQEQRVERLNNALAAFGAALDHPAGL